MVNNDLTIELLAMQQIAVALATLDAAARSRVLHWAAERLQASAPAVSNAAPPAGLRLIEHTEFADAGAGRLTDEALSVATLDDFFAPGGPKSLATAESAGPRQSVRGLLTEFVAEFQNIAHEWDDACDATAAPRTVDTGNQRASNAA